MKHMKHFYVVLSISFGVYNVFVMALYESADVYSLISVGAIDKCLKSLASVAISGAGNDKQKSILILIGLLFGWISLIV